MVIVNGQEQYFVVDKVYGVCWAVVISGVERLKIKPVYPLKCEIEEKFRMEDDFFR